ncbi:hypothetical protein PITC_070140 [Penicillium italicum]|uniref:Uncharacterized protein n=1 Tax=Penicillium italicum TaxID=40296 RepID=A0A0A2KKT4_PENIT|nr:hypothetical protein PITC_070140 [Penicillium italicum]
MMDRFLMSIQNPGVDPDQPLNYIYHSGVFWRIFQGVFWGSQKNHIHVTVQTNATCKDTSYSNSGVQYLYQLFLDEDLINSVYQLASYNDHLSTLNRTTNSQDSLYSIANVDGYSAVVSMSKLGDSLADVLVGHITICVSHSAPPAETTSGSDNVAGALPTVTPTPDARAAAYALDASDGYFEKKR